MSKAKNVHQRCAPTRHITARKLLRYAECLHQSGTTDHATIATLCRLIVATRANEIIDNARAWSPPLPPGSATAWCDACMPDDEPAPDDDPDVKRFRAEMASADGKLRHARQFVDSATVNVAMMESLREQVCGSASSTIFDLVGH